MFAFFCFKFSILGQKFWFIHRSENLNSNSSKYSCSFCENMNTDKSELLKHRNEIHAKHIPLYNNFEKGACIFGNENSWFNHDDNIKENESENENKDRV